MSKSFSKPVSQERSARTRDQLMQALESLLRQKSFDTISIGDLAKEAGVAVGTVYRRFENKEALIPLLFDLWHERSRQQAMHARLTVDDVVQSDLRGLLRKQMRAAYRFIREQAHILRAVQLYGRHRPDLIGEEWRDLWREAASGTRAFLQLIADRIARTELDSASEMVVYLANTALLDKALFGTDGAGFVISTEGDDFADQIADLVFGYLQTPDEV